MTFFSQERNGLYGTGTWVAVPTKPSLTGIISNSGLKDELFPYLGGPTDIDARKAIVEVDGAFVDLTITYSNNPLFDEKFYDLPPGSLDGYTTLHISAMGTAEKPTEDIVKKVLSAFPNTIDLDMKQEVNEKVLQTFHGMLEEFESQCPFFNTYVEIRKSLSNLKEKSHKKLSVGVILNVVSKLMAECGMPYSESNDIRLVKRVECRYKDMPLELSLLYMTGPQFNPGIYGVFLFRKHDKNCPAWEENLCDQSRSYAGYIFTPDNLIFGGSLPLPKMTRVYGGDMPGLGGRKDFCLKALSLRPKNTSWQEIKSGINSLNNKLQKNIGEIEVITRLVYDS